MAAYVMTVSSYNDDGSRTTSFWNISQMTAAVIRGCYGPPAEETLESAEGMAHRRSMLEDDIVRFTPEKESE
jgi:hypothetical protein